MHAATCVALPTALTLAGHRALGPRGRLALTALLVWSALGGRSLRRIATRMADLVDAGDLPAARRLARALVARRPDELDGPALTRAALESLAENTADAIAGPLLYAAVLGPAGAAAYRAANTLDAMVGYRNDRYARFGWAAARLDDALGWPVARATAAATVTAAALTGADAPGAVRAWRRDGAAHPSPNAGRVEAAFAGALRVRLGGRNVYGERVEDRPRLGDGPRADHRGPAPRRAPQRRDPGGAPRRRGAPRRPEARPVLTLVLGARRSGKSRVAEELAAASGAAVTYLAPLTVSDVEMAARVAAHRARRPADWGTVEGPDVLAALRDAGPERTVLLDSLGSWAGELLLRAGALDDDAKPAAAAARQAVSRLLAEVDAFGEEAAARPGLTVVVCEEAGWGPVPPDALRAPLARRGRRRRPGALRPGRSRRARRRRPRPGAARAVTAEPDRHGDEHARGARYDLAVNVVAGGPPAWLRTVLREALDHDLGAYPDEASRAARRSPPTTAASRTRSCCSTAARRASGCSARRCARAGRSSSSRSSASPCTRCAPPAAPRGTSCSSSPGTLDPGRVPQDADLVVVGNPTNPTGVLHPPAALRALLAPGRVVVVDEAFLPLTEQPEATLAGDRARGLVVLRSLTKHLAVPGLRVGYALAAPELARRLARPAPAVVGQRPGARRLPCGGGAAARPRGRRGAGGRS